MQELIYGSAQANKSTQAAFFKSHDSGFEMHFCTSELNIEQDNVQNWHCMQFDKDFIDTLKKYKRLPFASVTDGMNTINEFEKENKELK